MAAVGFKVAASRSLLCIASASPLINFPGRQVYLIPACNSPLYLPCSSRRRAQFYRPLVFPRKSSTGTLIYSPAKLLRRLLRKLHPLCFPPAMELTDRNSIRNGRMNRDVVFTWYLYHSIVMEHDFQVWPRFFEKPWAFTSPRLLLPSSWFIYCFGVS